MATALLSRNMHHTVCKMRSFSDLPVLGILGGMGPGAAVDFQQRILDASPAQIDQQHIPTLVWNHGAIPDRQLALKQQGESPLSALLQGLRLLEQAGVSRIAIPCNTAHYWHADLQQATAIPILNMVEITVQKVRHRLKPGDKVGILATRGALLSNLYQQELQKFDIPYVINSEYDIEQLFMPAVYQVKRNELKVAGQVFEQLCQRLVDQGASAIILACTEIPLGLNAIQSPIRQLCLDTTQILAEACVDWFYQQ